jgi:hypothetical protein
LIPLQGTRLVATPFRPGALAGLGTTSTTLTAAHWTSQPLGLTLQLAYSTKDNGRRSQIDGTDMPLSLRTGKTMEVPQMHRLQSTLPRCSHETSLESVHSNTTNKTTLWFSFRYLVPLPNSPPTTITKFSHEAHSLHRTALRLTSHHAGSPALSKRNGEARDDKSRPDQTGTEPNRREANNLSLTLIASDDDMTIDRYTYTYLAID